MGRKTSFRGGHSDRPPSNQRGNYRVQTQSAKTSLDCGHSCRPQSTARQQPNTGSACRFAAVTLTIAVAPRRSRVATSRRKSFGFLRRAAETRCAGLRCVNRRRTGAAATGSGHCPHAPQTLCPRRRWRISGFVLRGSGAGRQCNPFLRSAASPLRTRRSVDRDRAPA